MPEAFIIDAVRTPVTRRGGGLAGAHPADLGAHVIKELLARARAIMRRTQPIVPQAAQNRRYRFDAFVIDIDARGLSTGENHAVNLTSGEFELLVCFVQRPRRVLTRDQILDWTRGRSADPFDRTVDMLISRLRKKLDGASPGSNLINTVRNGGYLFTAHVRPLT